MPTVVLVSICLVIALLLSAVNMFTKDVIEANLDAENQKAREEVLPGGKDAEQTHMYDDYMPKEVVAVYKCDAGYIFQMLVTGKSPGMTITCGINNEGKITGTKCTANDETPSYSAPVFNRTESTDEKDGFYVGMTQSTYEIDIVSGSTKTSKAYAKAVKAALDAYDAIKGRTAG